MIDMIKNRERLEQEKKRFRGENFDENFESLLTEKEDDPGFKKLIQEYREVDAWINRYEIKDQNTMRKDLTKEEAEMEFGIMIRDTKEKYNQLIDLEEKILNLYYRQILRQEG